MSDRADGNRTVGMTDLAYRVIAGRECRVDATDGTVIVYDEATGLMIAMVYGETDTALMGLEDDVLANGW